MRVSVSETKPPLGVIRRICPRHERLEEPCRHSRPVEGQGIPLLNDPSVEWETWHELSCVSCTFEEMFRGRLPALEPRRITGEQYRTMTETESESSAS